MSPKQSASRLFDLVLNIKRGTYALKMERAFLPPNKTTNAAAVSVVLVNLTLKAVTRKTHLPSVYRQTVWRLAVWRLLLADHHTRRRGSSEALRVCLGSKIHPAPKPHSSPPTIPQRPIRPRSLHRSASPLHPRASTSSTASPSHASQRRHELRLSLNRSQSMSRWRAGQLRSGAEE